MMMQETEEIIKNPVLDLFEKIEINKNWSFSEYSPKETSYISHGYYTYPAKFIPQLASKLIKEHSKKGEIVVDTFMGSGTSVVESLVNERIGIGTDINEIAHLVAEVKSKPLNPVELAQEFLSLEMDLKVRTNGKKDFFWHKAEEKFTFHERIDYWFKPPQKQALAILLYRILEIENKNIQNFFIVTFAQILKTCSIWLQKSVKPTRDLKKKEADVWATFSRQAKKMIKRNSEFWKVLPEKVKENPEFYAKVRCEDARRLPCENEEVSLIVTSPPYVTSYEYADLHQLPLYWLGHLKELPTFRQKFIGSAYKTREEKTDLKSELAQEIVEKLGNNKKGREVRNYFADMLETFEEIHRVLKPKGKACIVIGNTKFKGVEILNTEVFVEQMQNIGFEVSEIIKREIPSKMLPSTRDKKTGQFVKNMNKNLTLAYPTEYILIMKKKVETKYLFFINFNSGLKHNALYQDLETLQNSIKQLFEEEEQDLASIPSLENIENHLKDEEEYFQMLENETWFHIQELTDENYIN